VYSLLTEAANPLHPQVFRETDLFRQCQAAGVIPRTETDLETPHPPEQPRPNNDQPPPHLITADIRISGMWCPACAWIIEASVRKAAGIHHATCNFSTDRIHFGYDPVQTSLDKVVRTIETLGFKVVDQNPQTREKRKAFIRFGICAFLTLNVMMLSLALYSGFFTQLTLADIHKIAWPVFLMTTAVMLYGGKPIFQKAWYGLRAGAAGMEVLVGMGTLSAYSYSVFNFWQGSIHVYFDTSAMLITLVLLGKLIESDAKDRVQADLENFLAHAPRKVRRCSPVYPQGHYETIDLLSSGDVFILADNEIAAADGIVLSGTGEVDVSSLTGEALPVFTKAGDAILSGCKILSGRLMVQATAVGNDSTLGQMIHVMEKALSRKTPLEGKTDSILRWFVPGILFLAVCTGTGWYLSGKPAGESLIRAITVMLISCPCALGIAIPLARVAGISMAGKKGILVRDFSAFEKSASISTFVFDKTGTLTTGRWSLMKMSCPGYYGIPDKESQILAYAAALEKESNHFIAAEIRGRARMMEIDVPDAEIIRDMGRGIEGRIDGISVKIGSPSWIGPEALDQTAQLLTWQDNGPSKTSRVLMHIEDQLAAIFVFGDTIRPTSDGVLRALRKMGKEIVMISGDETNSVRSVADQLGIDIRHAGLTPLDKADVIQRLGQQNGRRVAMVGDGINDAPALATADLAIAVHSGYPIGQAAADITLMRQDPIQLLEFLSLSRHVNRNIDQNLWFAFIYNLISIPVAMSGLLNPLVAVSAMLLSSLSVTGNTLRMIRKEKQPIPSSV
ncbi:MAG: cation-translocating P-type ATPase, partial [Desulfatirhabdiaceae bacterium]